MLVDGKVARVGLGFVEDRGDDLLHAQNNAIFAGHPDRGASNVYVESDRAHIYNLEANHAEYVE